MKFNKNSTSSSHSEIIMDLFCDIFKFKVLFSLIYRDRRQIEILVPGAGLGRLAYELAKLGFACEGNEFSLFMLFASNFVLNKLVTSLISLTLIFFLYFYWLNLNS